MKRDSETEDTRHMQRSERVNWARLNITWENTSSLLKRNDSHERLSGVSIWGKKLGFQVIFILFYFLFSQWKVREWECEVPIWDGGQMVLRWWRDDGEMVELWWSRSSFQIGDLGFTRIWIWKRLARTLDRERDVEKNWFLS